MVCNNFYGAFKIKFWEVPLCPTAQYVAVLGVTQAWSFFPTYFSTNLYIWQEYILKKYIHKQTT